MKRFIIRGMPRIKRANMKYYDRVEEFDSITNGLIIKASNKDMALDEYHATQPIECLDDWDIEAHEVLS